MFSPQAYAEGYELPYYISFVGTLRQTGFTGDIVLAIAEPDQLAKNVVEYLQSEENVIVYIHELHCFEPNGFTPAKRLMKNGGLDIFQMCLLDGIYGKKDEDGNIISVANDPRIGRVVATLRYEWYWVWSLQYNPNVWIMLVDARDTFFQTNPFEGSIS